MRRWWSRLARLLRGRESFERELGDEVQAHFELMADDHSQAGLTREDAQARARRALGNSTRIRENARQTWRFPLLEDVCQDVRYGLRTLRKSPGFSLAVILTLGLGIGVNTAVFTVLYAVLLRPLPYPASERLVQLSEAGGKASGISVTWINFQHWLTENRSFETMAGFQSTGMTLTGRGNAEVVQTGLVTSEFFELTGSRPLVGRLFTAGDDRAAPPAVTLLSYEFWNRVLGGDAGVVGRAITLNGRAYQVVGILPPGLRFFSWRTDLYLPLGPVGVQSVKRSDHGSMRVLARLRSDVAPAAARRDLDNIMRRLAIADPGPESDHRAAVTPLIETVAGDQVRDMLLLLFGAVGLILMLACANVSSLLLVRSSLRLREFTVRSALGAGSGRLGRQLLTETFLLTLAGGLLGVGLAALALRMLLGAAPASIPRLAEVHVDVPVLIFAFAITTGASLLAGLAPLRATSRLDLTGAFHEGGARTGTSGQGQYVRNFLVIAEIAMTLLLAFSAGLLIRSLQAAQSVNPGFEADHLLAATLSLPEKSYPTPARMQTFYQQLVEALRGKPGVRSAGVVTCPLDDCGDFWYSINGKPDPPRDDVPLALFKTADPAYFATMHLPLLAGRGFNRADRGASPPVIVINEVLARKWWSAPGLAVGQALKFGGPYRPGAVYEIVGVVGAMHQMGLDAAAEPEFYFAFYQQPVSRMTVVLRTRGAPAALAGTVRRTVHALDADLPVVSLAPLEDSLSASLERRRFSTFLLSGFALLALGLAAVGVYGVLNYWVNARRREIAVRLALGAQPAAIWGWAAGHAGRLAAAGVLVGLMGTWAVSRWLETMVFEISAKDPRILLLAISVVLASVLFAVALPLWRAAHVDAVAHLHEG